MYIRCYVNRFLVGGICELSLMPASGALVVHGAPDDGAGDG
jgi:hypothetical protein